MAVLMIYLLDTGLHLYKQIIEEYDSPWDIVISYVDKTACQRSSKVNTTLTITIRSIQAVPEPWPQAFFHPNS